MISIHSVYLCTESVPGLHHQKTEKRNAALMNYAYTKDGVTVAAVLDTGHRRADGKSPVRIRVNYAGRRVYFSTGKVMTREEWERMATSKSRAAIDVRQDIESSYNIVRDIVQELTTAGAFSIDALNRRLKTASGGDLNTIFKARIEDLRTTGRIGNMLCYVGVLKGVERFAGEHISLSAINVGWVERYAEHLRDEGKKQTTIAIHLRTLRAVLNIARREGVLKEAQYPFGRGRYEIQEGEGRKMALTLEQIGKIARYDDGTDTTAKYRDYWLFLYLCNGNNVADVVRLRYSDIVDGEIRFVRQKTARTTKTVREIRVTITDPMRRIIERRGQPRDASDTFIFPVLTGKETAAERKMKTQFFTRAINRRMADVAEALGIDHISTYTARHSFATVLKRAGANIAYISESLGHQDLKTTETYLASFERDERQKNAELLTKF